MVNALTDAQLQLLLLAQAGDVPLQRELRSSEYFGDIELLAMVGLIEPRGEWFTLTQVGVGYLAQIELSPGRVAQAK